MKKPEQRYRESLLKYLRRYGYSAIDFRTTDYHIYSHLTLPGKIIRIYCTLGNFYVCEINIETGKYTTKLKSISTHLKRIVQDILR